MTVAALFVEEDGCYSGLEDVDAWGITRDARFYAGPHPVVAHPPCQRWGALAKATYGRYPKECFRVGNDGGCFEHALRSVRSFGGVLEHPQASLAWEAFDLPKPTKRGAWARGKDGEWSCVVWQSAYGHRANKATWLFYVGERPPAEMRWERPRGTHQVGWQDARGRAANKPTLSKSEALATPPLFRDALLDLARNCRA